ncbi:MAG: right-handed parallel beta-helix repeat-containing protein [Thermoplasmata archaeon]
MPSGPHLPPAVGNVTISSTGVSSQPTYVSTSGSTATVQSSFDGWIFDAWSGSTLSGHGYTIDVATYEGVGSCPSTCPPNAALELFGGSGMTVTGIRTVSDSIPGIWVNGTASATIEDSTVTAGTASAATVGIWAGNAGDGPNEPTATYTITNNRVFGPGVSGEPGSAGIQAGGASLTITDNLVTNFSAETTNDWWTGTQSIGIYEGCAETATTCVVEGNSVNNNTIGVGNELTNSGFSGSFANGPVTITHNNLNNNTGYGVFSFPTGGPGTNLIENDTFNNSISGAPGVFLDGGAYWVASDLFIGTSTSGSQGASQGQCSGPAITTAAVEVTDSCADVSAVTGATLTANVFVDVNSYWSSQFSDGSSYLYGGELGTFTETGLPTNSGWSVGITHWIATGYPNTATSLKIDLQNETYGYSAVSANPGYTASPASGTITVTSGTVSIAPSRTASQTITFSPTKYTVTFTESGLPLHTSWKVTITTNSETNTTTGKSNIFHLVDGSYQFQIEWIAGYHTVDNGSFMVDGTAVKIHDTFAPTTYTAKFTETGFTSSWHTTWCVTYNGTQKCSTKSSIAFTGIRNGSSYSYTIGHVANYSLTGSYTGSGSISGGGGQGMIIVSVAVPWHLVKYTVTFTESGLPSHTSWQVTMDGKTTVSTGNKSTFSVSNGTYAFTIISTGHSEMSNPMSPLRVNGAAVPVAVTFT